MAYMNLLKFHSVQLPPMNCRIVLHPEKASYTSGDTISGELLISLQKELYCFGLKVALEGTALVKFRDTGIQSKASNLLEAFIYVYGKGDQKIRLEPGEHSFGFSLEFPSISTSLPGSFRSPFGLILFQIIAYVQLEWKSIRKSEKTIKVSGYLNLCQQPSLSSPICLEKCEKFLLPSLLGGRRGGNLFKFIFRISQTGFIAGEEIPFEMEVDNPNGYEIAVIQVSLNQKIIYNTGSSGHLVQPGTSKKQRQKVLSRVATSRMDNPTRTVWTEVLEVPQGISPNQKGSVIEISYIIKIEVKTNGQACPLRGEIPITIGTTRQPLSPIEDKPDGKIDEGWRGALGLKPAGQKSRGERSPSPCPRSKSARISHKSLERANSAVSPPSVRPRPPRYSQLTIRSSSVETLPPAYEESLEKVIIKSPEESDDESVEIAEFKKCNVEDESDDEEDVEDIEDPAELDIEEVLLSPTTDDPAEAQSVAITPVESEIKTRSEDKGDDAADLNTEQEPAEAQPLESLTEGTEKLTISDN